MVAFLIILAALVAVGLPLYFLDRRQSRKADNTQPSESSDLSEPSEPQTAGEGGDDAPCCGMHLTCQKDSLLAADIGEQPDYFDDEELDRYAGRGVDDYTDDEIEEFRDVLLTLLPQDIAPWARSVQLRGITLPSPVRDELLMIVAEARAGLEKREERGEKR